MLPRKIFYDATTDFIIIYYQSKLKQYIQRGSRDEVSIIHTENGSILNLELKQTMKYIDFRHHHGERYYEHLTSHTVYSVLSKKIRDRSSRIALHVNFD